MLLPMKPAERLQQIPPHQFALIGQRIREITANGHRVIRLDVGSPDTPPPPSVIHTLCESASSPHTHGYSGYKGTPEFRQAVARYYQRRFGVELDPEREILPLLGSKEGIINLAFAVLNPGDIVLIPDISYPSYAVGAHFTGAHIHWLPLKPENGYKIDLSAVPADVARQARLMWINYPNNPTGAALSAADYDLLVTFCLEHNILLASDNPYVEVTYDGYRAGSVLQSVQDKHQVIEFISFSKTYNMAGWRLGVAVGCAETIASLMQVKTNIDSGHFQAIYDAGTVALDTTPPSWISNRNLCYQRRRDRLMSALPRIGLSPFKPSGAIYLWARVQDGQADAFVRAALEEAHVSIGPGSIYGPGGVSYVRFSLTCPDDQLDEAVERLIRWCAR